VGRDGLKEPEKKVDDLHILVERDPTGTGVGPLRGREDTNLGGGGSTEGVWDCGSGRERIWFNVGKRPEQDV